MKTQEQVKCAADTISLLQDYITLAKIEKNLKSEVGQKKVDELLCEICDKANNNVGEVL